MLVPSKKIINLFSLLFNLFILNLSLELLAAEIQLPILNECPLELPDQNTPCINSKDFIFSEGSTANEGVTKTQILKYFSNEPWTRKNDFPQLGVALAGGGSKMAPFAMGVIKRFADEGWLEKTDLLSSVSGGGYTAYYLYKQAWKIKTLPEEMAEYRTRTDSIARIKTVPRIKDLFADVRNENYGESNIRLKRTSLFTPDVYRYGMLSRTDDKNENCSYFPRNSARHQSFVECFQDILSSSSGGISKSPDSRPYLAYIAGGISTLISLPFHHFVNSIFDWKIRLTPSQSIYQNGIERTYGVTPGENLKYPLLDIEENKFDFNALVSLYKDVDACTDDSCIVLPWWIINTTNMTKNETDLEKTVFELTPNSMGSGNYGYLINANLSEIKKNLTPLDAVSTSAAFFDSLSTEPPGGLSNGTIFTILHGLNLRWGLEIPNYRVDDNARRLHTLLPWPLYRLHRFERDKDSTNIRLADGGQSGENLGIYSLLRRGTRNIVVADGAYDLDSNKNSTLAELCFTSNLLQKYGLEIQFNDLPDKSLGEKILLNEYCDSKNIGIKFSERKHFSPYVWKTPVWVGKVVSRKNIEVTSNAKLLLGINIFHLKSAINTSQILKDLQLWSENKTVCNGDKDNTMSPSGLPCGIIGYIIDSQNSSNPQKWTWPQTSTVSDTADGSNNRFEAYRDLGWYVTGYLNCIENSDFPFSAKSQCITSD